MTVLLLTALGFAQSNVFEPDQYGTDVFHTTDRDQHGTDVFQTADRDQYGDEVFHTADRDRYNNDVFHAARPDQYGNEVFHTADRDQRGIDVFQTAGRDRYGNNAFPAANPQFMKEATQDAMAKINLARVALQNAQNEQVKSFAVQMLSDYGKVQNDLIYIANQQFVFLNIELDPKQQDVFETLSNLQGAAFDKAYMKAMLSDPHTDVSRFKQEATKGSSEAMKNWASQMLPTLESALKEAQKVAPAVGVHSTVTSKEQSTPSVNKPIKPVSQESAFTY
jgi:putative membrane protein